MIKIVLVTTVHNRKHLVGQAIQSAVNQTLDKSKWAHLILDNGSDDGADQICEVFSKKYNNVFLERMGKNLGQMPAYNWALKEWLPKNVSDATVMAHLDSDDMLAPFALEKINNMFDAHPEIGMAYSNFDIIGPSPANKIKHKQHPKAKQAQAQFTPDGQKQLRKIQLAGNAIGHMRSLSVKCLNEIGGFDETYRYSTDFNMACQMIERFPVVKIDGPSLYLWREHGDQIQGRKEGSAEQTQTWRDLQKYYRERWSKMKLI